MDGQLLEMKDIVKSFPGVKALSNAQLTLNKGEVVALIGENGAGKSTLMKILTGIYPKDEGSIIYEGKEIEINSPKEAQELGIIMIHQELNLMRDLSIAENIFIGREPKGIFNFFVKDKVLNEKTKKLLDKLNLDLDPRTKVGELTVAKQQMVEVAKALSFNSKLIIMDEPTTALTETEIDSLFDVIEQLKKDGVGIIYISHRMDELKRIADRFTIMRDGQYIDTLPKEGIDMNQVIHMMVGREIFIESEPKDVSSRNEVVLEVKGLCTRSLLKDINFRLQKGEILGIAGLMGAGRTEVARALFGADPVTSGVVKLHGQEVKIKKPADAVAAGIGYLSEDRKHLGLLLDKDVKMNIALASYEQFNRAKLFIDDKRIKETAESYIQSLNIKTPSSGQEIRLLSGGNQQKVVIAKWLLRDCDILIFDEPTRGIDIGAKGEIYKLLDELAASGKAIIMISSELPEILRMSHRIIVMAEGRITGELNAKEATQEKIMEFATAVHSEPEVS